MSLLFLFFSSHLQRENNAFQRACCGEKCVIASEFGATEATGDIHESCRWSELAASRGAEGKSRTLGGGRPFPEEGSWRGVLPGGRGPGQGLLGAGGEWGASAVSWEAVRMEMNNF